MKKNIFIFLSFVMMFGFGSAAACAQSAPADFSADVVSTSAEGTMTMKLYSSSQKSRIEMPGNIMIVRQDLQCMYMMMPDQGMYMEHPIDTRMVAKTSTHISGEVEREPMGTETIDGKPSRKFKVTYVAQGVRDSVYQWLQDGQIPVRIQAIDGSWSVDYKNISTAPQPASLFEPPAGFQKMAMPSMADMMGQMPAGGHDN